MLMMMMMIMDDNDYGQSNKMQLVTISINTREPTREYSFHSIIYESILYARRRQWPWRCCGSRARDNFLTLVMKVSAIIANYDYHHRSMGSILFCPRSDAVYLTLCFFLFELLVFSAAVFFDMFLSIFLSPFVSCMAAHSLLFLFCLYTVKNTDNRRNIVIDIGSFWAGDYVATVAVLACC